MQWQRRLSIRGLPVRVYPRRLSHPSVSWSTIQRARNSTFGFYSRMNRKNSKWWQRWLTEQPPMTLFHEWNEYFSHLVLGVGLDLANNPEEVAAWWSWTVHASPWSLYLGLSRLTPWLGHSSRSVETWKRGTQTWIYLVWGTEADRPSADSSGYEMAALRLIGDNAYCPKPANLVVSVWLDGCMKAASFYQ